MNVILITSDTLRRDCLGCYGAPPWARGFKTKIGRVHTPHLDRFARTAAVFDNAFITSFPTVSNDLRMPSQLKAALSAKTLFSVGKKHESTFDSNERDLISPGISCRSRKPGFLIGEVAV